jgi:hypothetical protein
VVSGTVSIDLDGSAKELRSLARWLRAEDEFRGQVSLIEQQVGPGELNGAIDAVVVVLTSGAAPTFARSFFDWLSRRSERGRVRLRVRTETGRELKLDCGSVTDARAVLADVQRFMDETPERPTG